MKVNLFVLLIVFAYALMVNPRNLYLRMKQSARDFYKCFKEGGNEEIMLFYEEDTDKVSVTEIIKAKNSGLNVDAIYYSCISDSVDSVARQMR